VYQFVGMSAQADKSPFPSLFLVTHIVSLYSRVVRCFFRPTRQVSQSTWFINTCMQSPVSLTYLTWSSYTILFAWLKAMQCYWTHRWKIRICL